MSTGRILLLTAVAGVVFAGSLPKGITCDADSDCFYVPPRVAKAGVRVPALLILHCNGAVPRDLDTFRLIADSLGWPAPRETAFKDSTHFVFIGRSLFITTAEVRSGIVTFELPSPWKAVTPWVPVGSKGDEFAVDAAKDLTANLIILSTTEPGSVTTGGFHVSFTPMGHWLSASSEVERVLKGVVPQFMKLIRHDDSAYYSVVLLPMQEYGGEAFRSSFAMTVDVPPSPSNLPMWGHTLAHEIFHYWNGSRLRGAARGHYGRG